MVDTRNIGRKGRCIVITSGKGGAGKSTVTAGLGAALCRLSKSVLLIDADEGLRCLDLMLGVANEIVYDLGDVLDGRCEVSQAMRTVDGADGLQLLAAPLKAGTLSPDNRLKELCASLQNDFDYILIDSTAGIGSGFTVAAAAAEEALVVVSPDPVCIRDAQSVTELLIERNVFRRRMVINRFDHKLFQKKVFPEIDLIIDSTGLQLMAVIPYDKTVSIRAAQGLRLTHGKAAKAFDRFALRLEGTNLPLPKLNRI